ncbi:hypothetical protein E2C01_038755 [Portunus trituberculatus]|uniref:Uncharacterized protein n=1 Tax=Portunus trituberculatus TaxID=210409 RepID=A0A5B7FBM7_PORTR|nr:hypothetical protein [Portunus trituberculatus]
MYARSRIIADVGSGGGDDMPFPSPVSVKEVPDPRPPGSQRQMGRLPHPCQMPIVKLPLFLVLLINLSCVHCL